MNIREMARRGELADYAATATGEERRRLRAETYALVQPVVFHQLTRRLELNRGHRACAVGVSRLDDPCLDRFHDDMDAVLDDVFRNARVPVHNLEGWVSRRLTLATVNGYRRRRGERGALQRPRVPRWLATRLGEDPALAALAVDVLEFVGNDVPAGARVWPTERWAERRGGVDPEVAHRAVLRDLDTVLTAMRAKPAWYEAYVERPLGRKPHAAVQLGADDVAGPADDGLLVELAGLAVDTIEDRLARGENPRHAVADVVTAVFGPGTVTAVDRVLAALGTHG
ncbi:MULTISPECIES: hypothetical protein [unclassified Saccharothrix]|uniref:hypothetical protein n=1 Tax=unclassified Saccharothrix TaxID=2593673 RepID=UPI00307F199B